MTGYIYALWNKNEDDVFYIGSSLNPKKRTKEHIAEGKFCHLNDEYLPKYNTGLNYYILDEIEFENRTDLFIWETYWIDQFRQWGFKLKNKELYLNFHFGLKIFWPKYGKQLKCYNAMRPS